MKTYLLIFLLAACGALALTPLVRRLCERLGWLDHIRDERRVHKYPVPRLGGVAIFGALVFSLGLLPFWQNLLTQSIRDNWPRLWPVLIPAVVIFACGVYDDLKGVNASFKFLAQGLAGALFYALGGRIEGLSVPFVGSVALPWFVGVAVTIFWVVAITNAFNLLDGLDGLAAGAALFASLVLVSVSYQMGQPHVTAVGLALCGALAGFLRYNFNPASIFLGDSGSLLIGFLLAALSIQGSQKASTAVALTIPLIAFGLPVFDTLFTLLRRFISGRPLFAGDREHVHHKLLERGWSQRKVVLVLYCACAVLGVASLTLVNASTITGMFLVIIGVAIIVGVNRLNYHELHEVQAGVRRNSTERRQRLANNVCVRRASQQMAQAGDLPGVVAALEAMLAHGQFDGAKVWFETPDNAQAPNWSWARAEASPNGTAAALHNWRLTLPLVTQGRQVGLLEVCRKVQEGNLMLDINLVCRGFAREMARALVRVGATPQPTAASAKLVNVHAAGGWEGKAKAS